MDLISVFDEDFKFYGRVLEHYDFSELFEVMKQLPVPEVGISYVASVKELEECKIYHTFKENGFGGVPIQIGYCNGTNQSVNCLEYHKSSEFNIAKDDIILFLGHQQDINDGKYDIHNVKAFHIPAGVGVELYATTLHYAPCNYGLEKGFQVACVLPKGTNIGQPDLNGRDRIEDKLCFGTNKWLLTKADTEEAKSGAHIGIFDTLETTDGVQK